MATRSNWTAGLDQLSPPVPSLAGKLKHGAGKRSISSRVNCGFGRRKPPKPTMPVLKLKD